MEIFLFLSNLVVFILVPLDIAYLAGFFEPPGSYLLLVNLIGVAITLITFRYKMRIRKNKEAKAVKPEVKAETSG
jgi:divalent metal cation (Fe/Co/Zn/Cd) transporter